jgi:hypothetical protein
MEEQNEGHAEGPGILDLTPDDDHRQQSENTEVTKSDSPASDANTNQNQDESNSQQPEKKTIKRTRKKNPG